MKSTELLYLQDSYLFTESAEILEISENEFWKYIILDRTIFYPQWGWQPSDMWIITLWENSFKVHKCMLDSGWVVYHYGENTYWEFKIWDEVTLDIDKDYRITNSRNHSAGHLVDVAMDILWYDRFLKAWKWFHFPEGSYVEYSGEIPEDLEVMREKLSATFEELSERSIPINVKYEWLWELEAPTGKSPRWVEFEWYVWCGCGGTHVKNSSEIGRVSVRKMKYKKWVLKVSYETEKPNHLPSYKPRA